MGSKSRETRTKQKNRGDARLAAYVAALEATGLEPSVFAKDPQFRKLRSELKDTRRRMEAINAKEALVEELAKAKKAKLEAAKKGGDKKKKKKKPDAKKAKPITNGFYKGVSWAVFRKIITRDDGTEVTVYNTVIEGRYKDKDGNYQSTSYFSENQLVAVEDAAREARQHIRQQRGNRKMA